MKLWGSPHRLAKTIAELFIEPPPPWWYEETFHAYWSKEAIQARKRRSRIRWSVGLIAVLAALIIMVVAYVFLAVPFEVLIVAPLVATAVVLLVVPSWRPFALVPLGPLFPIAVIWIGEFWPDALGGQSVGHPSCLSAS